MSSLSKIVFRNGNTLVPFSHNSTLQMPLMVFIVVLTIVHSGLRLTKNIAKLREQ